MPVKPSPCETGSKEDPVSMGLLGPAVVSAPKSWVNSPLEGADVGELYRSPSIKGPGDIGWGASGLLKNVVNSPGRPSIPADSSARFELFLPAQESTGREELADGNVVPNLAVAVVDWGAPTSRVPSPKPAMNCSVSEPGGEEVSERSTWNS